MIAIYEERLRVRGVGRNDKLGSSTGRLAVEDVATDLLNHPDFHSMLNYAVTPGGCSKDERDQAIRALVRTIHAAHKRRTDNRKTSSAPPPVIKQEYQTASFPSIHDLPATRPGSSSVLSAVSALTQPFAAGEPHIYMVMLRLVNSEDPWKEVGIIRSSPDKEWAALQDKVRRLIPNPAGATARKFMLERQLANGSGTVLDDAEALSRNLQRYGDSDDGLLLAVRYLGRESTVSCIHQSIEKSTNAGCKKENPSSSESEGDETSPSSDDDEPLSRRFLTKKTRKRLRSRSIKPEIVRNADPPPADLVAMWGNENAQKNVPF